MVASGSFVLATVAASGTPEYMHISGVASPKRYLNGDYHLAGENTNGAPAWHNPTTYNNWIQKIDTADDLTGAVRHCWAVVDDADRHASPAVAILLGQPCLENYTNPSDVPHWVDVVGRVFEGSMQVTGQDTPMDQQIPREVPDNLKHLAISGVPTDYLVHQDGYYTATDEVVHGANVWSCNGRSDRWLYRTAAGQWWLGDTLAKQGAGGHFFLSSEDQDGHAYPTDVPTWVYLHGHWDTSPRISVKAVTPCDPAKDCSSHGTTSDPDISDGCECQCDDGFMGSTCSMLKNSSSGLRCQVAQSINLTQLGNYFLDPLSQQPVLDWLNSCCCSRNCSLHPFVGDLRPHDVCPCPADEVSKGKDTVKECLKTVFNEPAGTGFLIGDDKSKRCVTFKHELTGVISGTDDAESAYFDDCSGNGFLSVISSFDADESYLQMGEDAMLEFHNKSVYSPGKPPYKLSAPHGSGNRLRFVNHGLVEADGTAIVGYVIGTDGMVANDYCWRSFGACTDLPPLIWVPKARPASSGHSVALAEVLPEKWDAGAGGGEAAQEVRKGWRMGTFGQASCMGLACLAAMLAWRRRRRAVSSDAAVPLLT